MTIHLHRDDATFKFRRPVRAEARPAPIAAADLNGDGRIDLAMVNIEAGMRTVLINAGGEDSSRRRGS